MAATAVAGTGGAAGVVGVAVAGVAGAMAAGETVVVVVLRACATTTGIARDPGARSCTAGPRMAATE